MTPATLAKECLLESNGDWEVAARAMQDRIDNDQKLFNEIMKPLVSKAIWDQIRIQSAQVRKSYQSTATPVQNKDNTNGLFALAKESWLNYPIWGGKRLGEATAADLDAAIAGYQNLADANRTQAERMRRVRSAIKDENKAVGEQLTEAQISVIMENSKAA